MSRTTLRTRAPPKPKAKPEVPVKTADVYCLCRGLDDGSPMVNCGECSEWYHFACVDLSEGTAEDINVYICPPCAAKTGQRTVMLWEGAEAVEDTTVQFRIKPVVDDEPQPSESDKDPESDDEYVADRAKRRRARRLSISSDSGSEPSGSEKNSRLRKRSSPGARKAQLKRKATKTNQPPAKRKKQEASARDDPARSFCLGKLELVFHDIFLRYPHVHPETGGAAVEKKPDDLTDAEKAQLEENAKQFAADLEQCVYEVYCEQDKMGKPSAGGKYKDRYRMLQFNLSKLDRTVLHKRIASGGITPKEISLMSSTDLANEQMQQSMKIAEQEALEHSILEKTVIPRAKLTHKGFEDIEDLDNVSNAVREREAERQRAEEEKRERERAARALRTRTLSMSLPPESPATPVSASWGAPPRIPGLPMSPTIEATTDPGPISDLGAEPEMNLADLINIDDEPPAQDASAAAPSSPVSDTVPSPTTTTGISPFAIKPESRASFDINSLWNAPPKKEDSPPRSPVAVEQDKPMDLDETDDNDFDMFLDEKDTVVPTPEILQAAFDLLPQVWSGKINMPLDSTIPQETPVNARQIGGRALESTSVLWNTLFPSDLLRIDGRVPVDKSSQFLLQTRMNSAKELIAVAFAPESPAANVGFQLLMDFLIAKGRHGLVFPWGSRPKEHHPGKELYIIPLLSSDSLPDYMELLDNFHLPKIRTANLLVGIWVLNKGKLVATSSPPPPAASVPFQAAASVPFQAPAPTAIPPFTLPIPSSLPQLGLPAPVAPPLSFEPSVLAAEVAALTPEQVRMMLQSLTGSIPSGVGAPIPVPVPPQPGPPPPPQAWGPPPLGYGPPPPHPGQYQQPPPHMPPYGQQQPHYERREYNREPGYDRGRDNSWNNNDRNNRNRGRGRGGGGGGPPPVSDSGWPRRQGQGQGRW